MTVPQPLTAAPAAPAVAAVVLAERLGKSIDERPILADIDLHVDAGQSVALLGANGAGKSTLLRTLATLTPYTHGRLSLFGQPLRRTSAAVRARIGMIGHEPMLYRDLSAYENLLFYARLYDLAEPGRRSRQLLEWVDLADRADDAVKTFSRGMVQRLAIARALLHEPELVLADEPFSGLDVPSVRRVEELLGRLHEAGKTVVLTNHNIAQSLGLAQRVVVLRRGRVVRDEPADVAATAAIEREVSGP